jgi:transcriptional regulator with XRE-family HTH domain
MKEIPVISRRLREARLAADVSQERLGVMAGIDEFSASARMNQYERGRHIPNLQLVSRIAATLGVPMAYFYADDDGLAALLLTYGKLTPIQRQQLSEFAGRLIVGA